MATPKFPTQKSFHGELKSRIGEYFKQKGKSTTGNSNLYIKAIILVSALLSVYVHLVFFTPPAFWAVIESAFFGCIIAAIGFNVMHDGAHGSFSRFQWINNLASNLANFLGASQHMWKSKHNIIHHTYTNIHGVDDDIEARPLLRLCDEQVHYKIHRYQHVYFPAAYSLLYIYWIFVTDYTKYFRGKIGNIPLRKMTVKEHISFWFYKLAHAFIFVALPIYMVGFTAWIIGFLTMGLVAGFVLSIVFQLAHTVEHTHFPLPNEATGKMEDEWAIHQIKTTANFATRNKVISWLVGGLNFQIEHHLFPKISHVHYPQISKIIRQACQDFNIEYVEYPKLRQAVASHVTYLRQLGKAS
ncbi:acyl-CoA desaturase [Segetibacter sp. 3557_3]|uniref:fatty acid desaturase family protein n=1 Tax=Segetibacter sp. 3557_3 TaxID=2547429 RepID=UPI0010585F46|nr:acyl-CoA desaturase [Segetibacter sp. 3557_3]TDH28932.1 acyl-CoA desaturase [Segetibacter sp. 3557_3]